MIKILDENSLVFFLIIGNVCTAKLYKMLKNRQYKIDGSDKIVSFVNVDN